MRSCSFDDLFEKKQRRRLRYVVVTLNILCFGYTVANIILCASYDELIDYFDSQDFIAYMLVTVVRNSIMGLILFIYGSHLFSRLSNYSSQGVSGSKSTTSQTLLKACHKLILLVLVSNGAFALQLVAVILWLKFDSSNSYYLQTPQHVHMSPYVYWLVLDCLPKVVPSVTFYLTMGFLNRVWDRSRSRKDVEEPSENQTDKYSNSNNSSQRSKRNTNPNIYTDSDDEKSLTSGDSINNILTSPLLKNGNSFNTNEDDEVFYNSIRSSLGENLAPSDLLREIIA